MDLQNCKSIFMENFKLPLALTGSFLGVFLPLAVADISSKNVVSVFPDSVDIERSVIVQGDSNAHSWDGFYLGTGLSFQNLSNKFDNDLKEKSKSKNKSAFGAGAFGGYNYQVGDHVFGIEAEVDYRKAKTKKSQASSTVKNSSDTETLTIGVTSFDRFFNSTVREPSSSDVSLDTKVVGKVNGRYGYSFGHMLVYGKAGVAVTSIKIKKNRLLEKEIYHETRIPSSDNSLSREDRSLVSSKINSSKTRVGFSAGAGVEYALDDNWSVRGEYGYTRFGSTKVTLKGTQISNLNGIIGSKDIREKIKLRATNEHAVKVGVGYKF